MLGLTPAKSKCRLTNTRACPPNVWSSRSLADHPDSISIMPVSRSAWRRKLLHGQSSACFFVNTKQTALHSKNLHPRDWKYRVPQVSAKKRREPGAPDVASPTTRGRTGPIAAVWKNRLPCDTLSRQTSPWRCLWQRCANPHFRVLL